MKKRSLSPFFTLKLQCNLAVETTPRLNSYTSTEVSLDTLPKNQGFRYEGTLWVVLEHMTTNGFSTIENFMDGKIRVIKSTTIVTPIQTMVID